MDEKKNLEKEYTTAKEVIDAHFDGFWKSSLLEFTHIYPYNQTQKWEVLPSRPHEEVGFIEAPSLTLANTAPFKTKEVEANVFV